MRTTVDLDQHLLKRLRIEARRLIIAQTYAGGDPPQEITTVRES